MRKDKWLLSSRISIRVQVCKTPELFSICHIFCSMAYNVDKGVLQIWRTEEATRSGRYKKVHFDLMMEVLFSRFDLFTSGMKLPHEAGVPHNRVATQAR